MATAGLTGNYALAPENGVETSRYIILQGNSFAGQRSAFRNDLEALLWEETQKWGVDYEKAWKLIQAESNWKESAVGDNGLAFGCLQFHKSTFETYKVYYEGLSLLQYKSCADQIRLAVRMIADGKGSNWSLYKRIWNSKTLISQ